MVKTRGSGDVAGIVKDEEAENLLVDQENDDISRKLRKRTSDASTAHLSSSDINANGGFNISPSKYSVSTGSAASAYKDADSDDDYDHKGRRTFQRGMAYRRHLKPDAGVDMWATSSQGSVRRSSRKRIIKYANMNEDMFAYDDVPTQGRKRRMSSDSEDDRRAMRSYGIQTRRSSRYDHIIPSDNDDMYSRIKSNKRRTVKKGFDEDETDTDIVKDELEDIVNNAEDAIDADNETGGEEDGKKAESLPLSRLRNRREPPRLQNEEATEDSSTESEEDEDKISVKKYNFRKRAAIPVYQPRTLRQRKVETTRPQDDEDRYRQFKRKQRRKPARHGSSTSDSSTSSDDERFERRKEKRMTIARNQCLPLNFKRSDLLKGAIRERRQVGSSLADIEPMTIDTSITFESIGGLEHHLNSLKEMIIFPLLYPEVFDKFKVQVPRGCLFYGPPGTGKTLVARALANECSTEGKKVAFFMRKGADCMSKWVGESERQLRLLFDQAYMMRPSIIFFDEIDGIAPVRSTRQDQIHSSIVSTLLALMDGLDSRGEVIVIGATNRIEAIDPALRRPGRFDREFYFPLPSFEARKHILSIHTKAWNPTPEEGLIQTLAERTVGYCGADLKALCSEAVLLALKRRYQQIYTSKNKLKLDYDSIHVTMKEFNTAINRKIIPASQRSMTAIARPLPVIMKPLLSKYFNHGLEALKQLFPIAFKQSKQTLGSKDSDSEEIDEQLLTMETLTNGSNRSLRFAGTFRPRLLICGNDNVGQSYIATALLQEMEQLNQFKVDSTRSTEELTTWFGEAVKKLPVASAIYVPKIEDLNDVIFNHLCSLLDGIEPTMPLLMVSTSEQPFSKLDPEVLDIFSPNRFSTSILPVSEATDDERRSFFLPLFEKVIHKPLEVRVEERLQELEEVAVPPQRSLNEKELKRLRRKEESSLRQLRNFLRDILAKIIRDKRFSIFLKPVDLEEVPDYTEVIAKPMDLETMMFKIDTHVYESAQQFLEDIDLITNNALEYNPNRDYNDKLIRHKACTLRDFANAIIDAEMDSDFEEMCQEMHRNRQLRGESPTKNAPQVLQKRIVEPPVSGPLEADNKTGEETEVESLNGVANPKATIPSSEVSEIKVPQPMKRRGRKSKKRRGPNQSTHENEAPNQPAPPGETTEESNDTHYTPETSMDLSTDSTKLTESAAPVTEVADVKLKIDQSGLQAILEDVVTSTKGCSLDQMENLYWLLFRTIKKRLKDIDRTALSQELKDDLMSFKKALSQDENMTRNGSGDVG